MLVICLSFGDFEVQARMILPFERRESICVQKMERSGTSVRTAVQHEAGDSSATLRLDLDLDKSSSIFMFPRKRAGQLNACHFKTWKLCSDTCSEANTRRKLEELSSRSSICSFLYSYRNLWLLCGVCIDWLLYNNYITLYNYAANS